MKKLPNIHSESFKGNVSDKFEFFAQNFHSRVVARSSFTAAAPVKGTFFPANLILVKPFFILRRRPVKTIFARVSFALLLLLLRTTSYLFLARRL